MRTTVSFYPYISCHILRCHPVRSSAIAIWLVADQRLLAAAREDNEDLLLEIFDTEDFDINYQDGCV